MTASPLGALAEVIRVLDDLGIEYIVCGSVASALHGEPRTTMDVDLVADLRPEHAEAIVTALATRYYVDRSAVSEAIARRSSFNMVHFDSAEKVDVFVARDRAFSREELRRGRLTELEQGSRARIASAEDTVLTKLEWFRKGGEVSERQWRDVLGILKVQGAQLDRHYMRHWAEELEVLDLLGEALGEAGLDWPP